MRPRGLGSLALALAFAGLLASLSLVVWRQSRVLETMRELEAVRSERALAEAERWELLRRIQHLESRGRVVPAATNRLGMRVPMGAEIVLMTLDEHTAPELEPEERPGDRIRRRLAGGGRP